MTEEGAGSPRTPSVPDPSYPGRLITFEGGEGAGKTTQLARLAAWLEGRGLDVVRTREPGGTPEAEAIRRLLVEGAAARWLPSTELLLAAASRDEHLHRLVLPALARGAWVLCDRYLDSTLVYQGLAGGLGLERIATLHDRVMGAPRPDLTLLLDLPVEEGLRRRRAEGAGGRFEAKGDAFHRRVRDGFLSLAAAEPGRIAVLDAALPPDRVAADARAAVAGRFGLIEPS